MTLFDCLVGSVFRNELCLIVSEMCNKGGHILNHLHIQNLQDDVGILFLVLPYLKLLT